MKRRMTCCMAAWAVLLCGTILGNGLVVDDGWVVSSATSGRMAVDTRAGKGTLETDHAVDIAYSGLWDGDAGATATVAVNGRTVKTATGEGTYTWTPPAAGTYTLTHRTTKDGVPVGETLTATFTVASRVAPPNAPSVADRVWTLVWSTSSSKPSTLVSPDKKWRLRAAPQLAPYIQWDGRVRVSFYDPYGGRWEYKSCVISGKGTLTLPVRARDREGRTYAVDFGDECFADCASVTRVVVPDALDADLPEALIGMPKVASFSVGGGNRRYFARGGALFARSRDGYADVLLHYPNAKAGTSYAVPDGAGAVSAWAFECHGKLKTVTLPPSVRTWGTESDWEGDNAWYAAARLSRIALSGESPYLKVSGGALYTKDGETLLRYPPARTAASATVAPGTARIAPAAFARAGKLASVSLPDSLREIGSCAFSSSGLTRATVPEGVVDISDAFCGAGKLAVVSLPSTLGRIDDAAFDNCPALKRVDVLCPSFSTQGDGCDDVDDGHVCWGDGLPASFGIHVPAESGITRATSGHFHDTKGKRRAVPILGTSVTARLNLTGEGDGAGDAMTMYAGTKFDLRRLNPFRTFWSVFPSYYSLFAGWWYTGADGEEVRVTSGSTVPSASFTLHPEVIDLHESRARLISADAAAAGAAGDDGGLPTKTTVYDGYLYGMGEVEGTILVRATAARTDVKTKRKTSRVNATVRILGCPRVSVTCDIESNWLSIPVKVKMPSRCTPDGYVRWTLELALGRDGLAGTLGPYTVDGARRVFSSKASSDKKRVSAALAAWKKPVNVAWRHGEGEAWRGLTATVGGGGSAKVAGTLPDGTKFGAAGRLLVGRNWSCLPVAAQAKDGERVAFVLWLSRDGAYAEPEGLGAPGTDAVAGRAGTLAPGAAFRLDVGALAELAGDWTYAAYAPDGVAVERAGSKWRVAGGARPGVVALGRDGAVDEARAGANPGALALAWQPKDGSFAGSFRYYRQANGRPSPATVTVRGVLVDGVGYGAATLRGRGSVEAGVE